MNLLLTTSCVRSCPYCFAKKEMDVSNSKDRISWDNIIYVSDFLKSSGQNHISLLGGEPTLHPQFVDIVLYLIERGFFVNVFTSGVMNAAMLYEVQRYLRNKKRWVSFICNLNDPDQTPAPLKEIESVHSFLDAMGTLVTPGYNIYRIDFHLEFIFDLVTKYGLKRDMRLGLAHPIPGAKNSFISPYEIGDVVKRLFSYANYFNQLRISLGFDCGFPLCKVTNEQIGWLYRLCGNRINFGCGMPLDINPDMSIYSCFPLSNYHRRSLFEFDHLDEIVEFYEKRKFEIRSEIPGVYEECDGCIYLGEGRCDGGGTCQLLNRMIIEPPIRLPEINNGLSKIRAAV
ncbi:MAG: radical SAM protein [Deltaproteobacteria bacterium]